MDAERIALYKDIEQARNSKVLVYFTGDSRGLETKMSSEVLDLFVHHLDIIKVVDKISLVLYTRGGETLSAWSLANLLRTFCDELEIVIPATCHRAGTLLCLGADNLVMTKQATLGPIDPSVTTPLDPQLPGGEPAARVPVSVEDVTAFLEQAREALGHEPIAQIGGSMKPKTLSSRNTTKQVPSPTGMAPVISQGTAATDNLSAMMKNTVVVVNVRKVDALPRKSLDRGTSDVRQDS